jgi:hypothetical protein
MAEVVVLSDDEGETSLVAERTRILVKRRSDTNTLKAVRQDQVKPYKLVLVDSRRCPQMPRPRFLPITLPHEAVSGVVWDHCGQSSSIPDPEEVNTLANAVTSAAETDDDEEDSDYEDVRPLKKRRTGGKKMPKKHEKLIAPDWEVVWNGEAGARKRPMPPAAAMLDRKEARDYVKRLTANIDWGNILRHLEMLKLTAAKLGPGEMEPERTSNKPGRGPSQATRLKQYWQNVMTNSVMKMDVGRNK